jgi:hypothetical protein
VKEFFRLSTIKFNTRLHQLAQNGFQWFFNKIVITVWIAPNYMYHCGNRTSVMKIDKTIPENGYELITFDKMLGEKRKIYNEIPSHNYFLQFFFCLVFCFLNKYSSTAFIFYH